VEFFRDAPLEVAELALHVASVTVNAKVEAKAAASQRMAKARAGRGKKAAPVATETVAAPTAAPVPATRVARAGHVQAPSHTAHATSVESDTQVPA
jgi:hypothetical protein